jgi:hypothetical protein
MTDANQPAKPPFPACSTQLDLQKREPRRLDVRIFHALAAARLRGLCASLHAASRDVHYLAATPHISDHRVVYRGERFANRVRHSPSVWIAAHRRHSIMQRKFRQSLPKPTLTQAILAATSAR